MVVKSLDEAVTPSADDLSAADRAARPADQLTAPELVEAPEESQVVTSYLTAELPSLRELSGCHRMPRLRIRCSSAS